jgi:hypothetical protein
MILQDQSQRAFANASDVINEHRHGISWGAKDKRQNAENVFGKRAHADEHGYVPE